MAASRNRAVLVAGAVLVALVAVAVLTREREGPAPRRGSGREEPDEPDALVDCGRVTKAPDTLAQQEDPRRFAEAYFCAWGRRQAEAMRKVTLSPQEVDDVVRPALGPEAGGERREVIRRRALDAWLHLGEQVPAIYDGVRFWIDGVTRLPTDLEPIFEERSHPRLLLFRAQAPGKEEEGLRTVLAKVPTGEWRFVPGIADPEPDATKAAVTE